MALPTIEIVPAGRETAGEFIALAKQKRYDYCAFMSAQAVDVLFSLASPREILAALARIKVIAVGPRTRQRLLKRGVRVHRMPPRYSSEGLVELLYSEGGQKGSKIKIIIPRSGAAGEFAAKALAGLGMQVDEVLLYTVRTARPTPAWKRFAALLAQKKVDAVVFTSASSVSSFFEILGQVTAARGKKEGVSAAANRGQAQELGSLTKVVSIGPFTSRRLGDMGVTAFLEAKEHTVRGTVDLASEILSSPL